MSPSAAPEGEPPSDTVEVSDWSRVQGQAHRSGPTIALSIRRDGIYRGDELLVTLVDSSGSVGFRPEDKNGTLCTKLRAALLDARGPGPVSGDGTVVLRASDEIPFEVIRVVLYTAAQAGFPQHELQARPDALPADG